MNWAGIKCRRERLGLSAGWVATQLGVGQRVLDRWEAGDTEVKPDYEGLLDGWEDQWEALVDELLNTIDYVGGDELVELITYAHDHALAAKHPGFPFPAQAHRAIICEVDRVLKSEGRQVVIRY